MEHLETFIDYYNKAKIIEENLCFIIAKSNNKNIISYFNPSFPEKKKEKPLMINWQTWENRSEPLIENLSKIEKKLAYGIKKYNIEDGILTLNLNGYSKLPIQLKKNDNEITPNIVINNITYYLLGIFVHLPNNNLSYKPKGISVIVKSLDGDITNTEPFQIYIKNNDK